MCSNFEGGYDCTCNPGYTELAGSCVINGYFSFFKYIILQLKIVPFLLLFFDENFYFLIIEYIFLVLLHRKQQRYFYGLRVIWLTFGMGAPHFYF